MQYENEAVNSITLQEAYEEYQRNASFRKIIESGKFKYVDNYFVKKNNKYIVVDDNGKSVLTKYAKDNIKKCTLSFSLESKGDSPKYIEKIKPKVECCKERKPIKNKLGSVSKPRKSPIYCNDQMKRQIEERKNLPRNFHDMFNYLFENRNWTTQKFKDKTLLSDNELSRIRRTPPQTSKRTMMAVCIGMELPLDISLELMQSVGIVLVNENHEDSIYKYILSCNIGNIDEVNDFLIDNGLKPLGQQQRCLS